MNRSVWYNKEKYVQQWYDSFNLFAEYHALTGEIPNRNTVYAGYNIGGWLVNQRKKLQQHELPQVFVNILNSVSPNWVIVGIQDRDRQRKTI